MFILKSMPQEEKKRSIFSVIGGVLSAVANITQIIQFLIAHPITGIVVGLGVVGTSYAGYKAYTEVISPRPTIQPHITAVATVYISPAFKETSYKQRQLDWQKKWEEIAKYWHDGDFKSFLSVTINSISDDNLQDVERRYNNVLLNWRLLDDVKLVTENAKVENSSNGQIAIIPYLFQNKTGGEIKLIIQNNHWLLRDYKEFLDQFTFGHLREVTQELKFFHEDKQSTITSLSYVPAANFFDVRNWPIRLSLNDGCVFWEGKLYAGDKLLTSKLGGTSIELREADIYDINKMKVEELEIRDIKVGSGYMTNCGITTSPAKLKLY